MNLSFDRVDTFSPADRSSITKLLTDSEFGEFAIEWSETFSRGAAPGVSVSFWLARDASLADGQLVAVAFVHHISQLDLAPYLGRFPQAINSIAHRFGASPFTFDFHFVEIPLANTPGVVVRRDLPQAQRNLIADALLAHIRQTLNRGFFAVKASTASEDALSLGRGARPGYARVPFMGNTKLTLTGTTFEDHLNTLSASSKLLARKNQRRFDRSGARMRFLDTVNEEAADKMAALFAKTEAAHSARGAIQLPIKIGRDWFLELSRRLGTRLKVLVCELDGEWILFCILLVGESTIHMRFCGLDYDKAPPCRAYFNMYYDTIREGYAQGVRHIYGGSTTYEVKRRIGFEVLPTAYALALNNYNFALVDPLLARFVRSDFKG